MADTNRNRILDIIAQEFEDYKVAVKHTEYASYISYARGASLDEIGNLLHVPRQYGQSDIIYRSILLNVLPIRLGGGTKQFIIEYIQNYLDIDTSLLIFEEPAPGYIQIQLPEEYSSRQTEIQQILNNAKAAGVYATLVYAASYWDDADAKWDDSVTKWR